MKLDELIGYRDKGIIDDNGRELVIGCAVRAIPGLREFISTMDALYAQGLTTEKCIDVALKVAREFNTSINPTTPVPAHPTAAVGVHFDRVEIVPTKHLGVMSDVNPPKTFREAMELEALKRMQGGTIPATPPKPTFEESLNDHQKKCLKCRGEALKAWTEKEKQGR